MKKIFALLLVLCGQAYAVVTPPANVSVGPYQTNGAAQLFWDEDTTITSWQILLNGKTTYSPARSDTGLTSTTRRVYLMQQIASTALPVTIVMKAITAGQPASAVSSAVTLTASVPPGQVMQIYNLPGYPLYVSGSFAPATGAANSAVSMTADTSAASTTRNAYLSSLSATAIGSYASQTTAATAAATAANQTLMNANLAYLTTNAASIANQTTMNNYLSSISATAVAIQAAAAAIQTASGVLSGTAHNYSSVYDASNILNLHVNTEDFLGSLSPTAAAAEAFKYLTPSALTTVYIGNIGSGAGTVYVAFSNSSTALNPNSYGIPCVPGVCTFTNPAGTYLHYTNPNTLTITSAVHDWLTPALSGTTLPQTPPFN